MLIRSLILAGSLMSTTAIAQQASSLATVAAQTVISPLFYQLDGVIEASQQAQLSAEISGRVEQINFDVGDQVAQGEVLIRVRDLEYAARLDQAKAQLAEASAGLKQSQQEFKRSQGMFKEKLVSASVFDKAGADLQASKARVAASQASVAELQQQLDNTVIRAPYSGIVIARYIEPGESISVGQKLMAGYARDSLRVLAQLPQSMLAAVREQRNARVLLASQTIAIDFDAVTIFPYADAQNHSFKVRLKLPAITPEVYPGESVKVEFQTDQIARLLIPSEALVYRSEVVGAYVMDADEQLSFRLLRPGRILGDRIAILAGLDPGERVALDPVRAGILLKSRARMAP